jgi:hypothetical protein
VGKSEPGQNPQPAASTDDEAAILASPQLTTPITLHLNQDGYQQAQELAALNGSDPRPTYGAAYEASAHSPCGTNGQDVAARLGANVYGVAIDDPTLSGALMRAQLYQFPTYTIQYPNRTTEDNGTYNVFACAVVADTVRQYLSPNQAGADLHNGIYLNFARRTFTAWTYRNRYETQIPGRGTVKVFAGTLTYRMDVSIPIGSYNGDGSASIKAMLNPDKGTWEISDFELHDPQLMLR